MNATSASLPDGGALTEALWARAQMGTSLAFHIVFAAVAQVTAIIVGWGLAQRPFLVAPDVTLDGAAAPPRVLVLVLSAVAAGALLLVPSLYYMLRVFKRAPVPGNPGARAGVEGTG